MLKSYFKIAWRNLVKRKFYSLVTIFGLSAGMTFSFLIGSYVMSELRINTDLRNADNQYIVTSKWRKADMGVEITALAPLAKAMKDNYPSLVENYYRYDGITTTVSRGDKHFKEGVIIGDSTALRMYGFPLLYGDEKTALDQPNSIVIPYDKAIKYFGKTGRRRAEPDVGLVFRQQEGISDYRSFGPDALQFGCKSGQRRCSDFHAARKHAVLWPGRAGQLDQCLHRQFCSIEKCVEKKIAGNAHTAIVENKCNSRYSAKS